MKLSDAPGSYSRILDALRPKLDLIGTTTYTLSDGTAMFSGFAKVLSPNDTPKSLKDAIMSSKAAIEAEIFEGQDGVLVDEFHTGIEVGDDDYLLMRSESFSHVLERVSKILGSGGEALLYEEGFAMGQENSEQMIRVLGADTVRSKSDYLGHVLPSAGWGSVQADRKEDGSFLVKLTDCIECRSKGTSRLGCNFMRGYFGASVQQVFGTEMDVKEVKCRLKGATHCEFVITPKRN